MFRLSRIDRQFRRFLRTGDARALGVVFDATAPELLKIAAYLAHDRQGAEDLVQSTFLVALERRAEFDTTRAVMPWLCGIVANLARAERRRAQRPVRSFEKPDRDPAAAAELQEFRAAFESARDGLGQPYRSVLELYLDHGSSANEIARLLDRPAGTVRAQIARGLEMLRKRLPSGFVASVIATAVTLDALPAIRTAVLARVRDAAIQPLAVTTTPAASTWATAMLGAGIMNKKLVLAGMIGAALVALGLWLTNRGAESIAPESNPAASRGPEIASTANPNASTDSSGEPMRAAASSGSRGGATAPVGRVEVQVRWQSDGAPAVRQSIEIVCARESLAELQPRRALTDAAGSCAIEDVPVGEVTVFASTGQHERVTVRSSETTAVALELEAWGIVRGKVVDPQGVGVPDADVWVSSDITYRTRARGGRPGRGQFGNYTIRTDAAGNFETRLGKRQCLSASKRGFGPSPTIYACSGTAPPEGIEVELQLTAEGSALVVEVRDAAGSPIADAHVLAGPETPNLLDMTMTRATPPPQRGTSDARGLAELGPLPLGRLPLQVRARGFSPWHGVHELLPSAVTRAVVRLQVAPTVRGVVTDETGTPVPNALVHHGSLAELASSSSTTDAAGRFELNSLPSGAVELTAWKEGIGSCTTELTLESGSEYTWHPLLSKRPAITGVVLGVDGKPAVGAYVACANMRQQRDNATGRTDASGKFMIGPLRADAIYAVTAEVMHPGQGALRVGQRGVPVGSELVLRVAPGEARTARLRGRLLEADGAPATRVHLTVTPLGSGVGGAMGHFAGVEQNGEFAIGPSKAGRIRIAVRRQGVVIADLGEHELLPNQTVDLGDVRLPTPGGAVVNITGGDVTNGVANLYLEGRFLSSVRLANQQAQWDTLPPGTGYRVSLRRGGTKPFVGAAEFAITSGSTTRAELSVDPAHVCELRFLVAGVCRRTGTLIAEDTDGREVLRHDLARPPGNETARVLLPAGTLRLRFRTTDGWSGNVRASIPASGVVDMTLTK